MSEHRNALAAETSPYLLQHADNPVQWYPWGETALTRARAEQKPILLSVGYSACHWCHVMAHESFEDEATAALMNENFINIKVDREERPDIDRIYQLAQQMLTQRNGGWPLTMFLTHDDHMPFFGGTYFPRESRYGLPGFREVLRRIVEFYQTEQDAIKRQNLSLLEALNRTQQHEISAADAINAEPLTRAVQQLEQGFDAQRGGFGAAPKFPHPTHIERLLRHAARHNDDNARDMALFTLRKMAEGGIYDHLAGGFCRYSVDAEWIIPHFEKMLYDNGPLLTLYAEAWQISGDGFFKRVAEQTADWVLRDMRSAEGGFYSSLDADSEGEEGRFYVWTTDETRNVLNDEQLFNVFSQHYGLDQPPNFEGEWHLRISKPLSEIAAAAGIAETELQTRLDAARATLLAVREQRIWPGRDDKLLVSWNALMIKGLAVAGRVLQRADWIDAAAAAVDCLRERLWVNGRLCATCKDGRAHLNAYLDDYAFLIDALLNLMQARWRKQDLDFAIELADVLLEYYQDPNGGFFFTADDHEQLIQRSKPLQDDSLPSGNGIAAFALQRLGHLLGEPRYLDAAARTLQAGWPALADLPFAHNALLLALEEYLQPPQTVIIRATDTAAADWLRAAQTGFQPGRLALLIPASAADLPGALAGMQAGTSTTAYICSGSECSAPVSDLETLRTIL
ncbi:MAG: thioredoxin domain-containing protein [Gammaproteobacteria bacterium]